MGELSVLIISDSRTFAKAYLLTRNVHYILFSFSPCIFCVADMTQACTAKGPLSIQCLLVQNKSHTTALFLMSIIKLQNSFLYMSKQKYVDLNDSWKMHFFGDIR